MEDVNEDTREGKKEMLRSELAGSWGLVQRPSYVDMTGFGEAKKRALPDHQTIGV